MPQESIEDELIEALQDLALKIARRPEREDIENANQVPDLETYTEEFGSYRNALLEAGVGVFSGHKLSDEQLLEYLRNLSRMLGRPPKTRDLNERSGPTCAEYQNRFGTLSEARSAAGLADLELDYSKPKLLKQLIDLADELDRSPTSQDIKRSSGPNPRVFREYFDSLVEARAQAETVADALQGGGKDSDNQQSTSIAFTDEELMSHLRSLSDELGHHPTTADIDEAQGPNHQTYCNRFGGIQEALSAAGVE